MVQGLKDIVSKINLELAATLALNTSFFDTLQIYGLAGNAYRKNTTESYPVIFDKAGEGVYVGADDVKSLIMYHRCTAMNAGLLAGSGYGDSRGKMRYIFSMTLVAWFDRFKTQLEPDELAVLLTNSIPNEVQNSTFKNVLVGLGGIVLNTQQVFASEYKNVKYFVKPEQSLISVSYTLESRINQFCFNASTESFLIP